MGWDWNTMQAHYVRLLQEAKDRGVTQEQIAATAGLLGRKQSYVSKIKTTRMPLGPAAEIFIRLIAGLGRPVSDFFADLEGRSPHVRAPGETSAPPSESPLGAAEERAVAEAIIKTLKRGIAAPVPTSGRRRRKKHR